MIKDILGNEVFKNIILMLALIVFGQILLKLIEKFIKRFFGESERSHPLNTAKLETISKTIYSIVRFIIYFIMLIIILDMFGINTRSLIATAGVGGVAIAFGAQSIIRDFITGVFMILDDMIRVGDFIDCAGVSGTVESVGLRLTKLRDYDGSLHTIPNSQVKNVKNYNRGGQKAEIYFSLPYSVRVDQAKEICQIVSKDVVKEEGLANVFIEPARFMEINDLGAFSYKVRMTSTVIANSQYEVKRKLRLLIKRELDKREINPNVMENV